MMNCSCVHCSGEICLTPTEKSHDEPHNKPSVVQRPDGSTGVETQGMIT